MYIFSVVLLASLSCLLTLTTKTVVPSAYRLSTFDENLAAETSSPPVDVDGEEEANVSPRRAAAEPATPPMIYYSAAGSGVAEVRVILSGFVIHGFLGLHTLVIKTTGLVLSVASGLSLGKEGPYVHIATCVGNIACRLFTKYDRNDGKRREVLSAAAAAGVAVAFGAPLGGVLFGLEEVAYFFPAKTLFRTFFCCITAALTLKFLNPYGTHKIVMFQIRYVIDWEYFELGSFIMVGVLGGAAGALFIKASRQWAKSFRRIPAIKQYPLLEVVLVALVTGITGYWNVLTKLPVAKLLYNLAAPCDDRDNNLADLGLCPTSIDDIPPIIIQLFAAFLVKGLLTIITFGIVSGTCMPTPFPVLLALTSTTESTGRHLRTVHGGRRSDGPADRALRPVDRDGDARMDSLGYLLEDAQCHLHPAGRVRPDRRRGNHVRRDPPLGDPCGHPI